MSIQRAIHCHQTGRFEEARHLYSDVIRQQPQNFDALHLLGVLHIDQKDFLAGANLIQHALTINPRFAKAHFNLGLARLQLERWEEALASFTRALALQPEYPEALNSRAKALAGMNRLEDAVASYDQALALRPDYPQALCNRGAILGRLAKHEQALQSFGSALALRPDFAEAYCRRGHVHFGMEQLAAALADYDRALELQPAYPVARCHRANALGALSRHEDAVAEYDRLIVDQPGYADALAGRGGVLARLKRFDAAMADYAQALAIDPRNTDALHNRGLTLMELRRYEEAIQSFEAILGTTPGHFKALHNLGVALLRMRALAAAVDCFDAALAQRQAPDTLLQKAEALLKLRRLPEAIATYERAFAIEPEASRWCFTSLYLAKLLACDWVGRDDLTAKLHEQRITDDTPVAPFILMCIGTDAQAQSASARRLVRLQNLDRIAPLGGHAISSDERIRVAYLSANFNSHPVAHAIAELLEKHDREKFEVIGVSFGVDDGSDIRKRVAAACDRFVDVYSKTDAEVAVLMRDLRVAIAVDLMGHTDDGRPAILAHRPAPVQVNYLGYPGTSAAPHIDYIVADRFVLPPSGSETYTEHVVWLPGCYLPSDSRSVISTRAPTRAEQGLPEHGFVFCSFSAHYKITPEVFDVWMSLLERVAGSSLWLQGSNPTAEQNLRLQARARGVDPQRIVFATRAPRLEDHLARHALADLFLDTFPYNAHTTARDALWAGLPVVTCAGATFPSRVAASVLHAAGMSELIADSLAHYQELAVRLASDPDLLQAIKLKVSRCRTTGLFDTARYARHLEAAYLTMLGTWRSGQTPASFAVDAVP